MGSSVYITVLPVFHFERTISFTFATMSGAAAQVAMGMPKLIGLMTLGPASFLACIQGAKVYRNFNSVDEDNKGHAIGMIRDSSVSDRLTAGKHPPVAYFNEK